MDAQAEKLLEVLRAAEIDVALKIDLTNKLKAYIKHHSVPASALANSFECIRICLSKLELCDVGFSTLSHLSKRVIIQKQQSILAYEGSKTFDILLDRLGDSKERVQQRAGQAFIDFWSGSPQDVETFIRDEALTTKNARAKKASLQWIVQVGFSPSLYFSADGSRCTTSSRCSFVALFQPSSHVSKTPTIVSERLRALPSPSSFKMLPSMQKPTSRSNWIDKIFGKQWLMVLVQRPRFGSH